jgi:glycosyltransferase involved in cell wall biosynthesis
LKKNILFLTHNIPAERNPNGYRVQQYFPYLQKKGYEITVMTSKTSIPVLIGGLRAARIVYVQRLLPGALKRNILKLFGKRIVFDFDDAVMYGERSESRIRRKRFICMIKIAELAFCGNSFLLAEAKRYKQENVFYVPTVVDTESYAVKEHTGSVPFVVGWMGSASTLKYFQEMAAGLSPLSGSSQFKVVADKPPDVPGFNIEFEKWSGAREKEALLSFDTGIMPIRDDLWSRGKCGLKLIQYGAAGLPSLSHPFGVSNEIIDEGENGFLRKDIAGWVDALERLQADFSMRKRMGRRARAIVEERYSLLRWGPHIASILDGL